MFFGSISTWRICWRVKYFTNIMLDCLCRFALAGQLPLQHLTGMYLLALFCFPCNTLAPQSQLGNPTICLLALFLSSQIQFWNHRRNIFPKYINSVFLWEIFLWSGSSFLRGVSNNQLRRSLIFPTQVFLWTLVRAWNVYLYDSITPK